MSNTLVNYENKFLEAKHVNKIKDGREENLLSLTTMN